MKPQFQIRAKCKLPVYSDEKCGDWFVWKRYKTEMDREKAFKALSEKNKLFEYRKD